MTGKKLNRVWNVNANHALYRKTGDWYHQLKKFPGALFDENGYILFNTEEEFRNCSYLQIKQDVNVPDGISSIPGYQKIKSNDQQFETNKEFEESNIYYEGEETATEITNYERNLEARKKCIEYYGFNCSICDMNFYDVYGKVGKGLIHVHHLRPISTIGKNYKIDPIMDLRPVCPNCHSVIHKRKPPFTIEEVKSMLVES